MLTQLLSSPNKTGRHHCRCEGNQGVFFLDDTFCHREEAGIYAGTKKTLHACFGCVREGISFLFLTFTKKTVKGPPKEQISGGSRYEAFYFLGFFLKYQALSSRPLTSTTAPTLALGSPSTPREISTRPRSRSSPRKDWRQIQNSVNGPPRKNQSKNGE